MELDAVKNTYARWAPIYDRTFGALTAGTRACAVGHINALPGRDVLELGVGTGLALPHYGRDRRVTGIDFSDEMLAKARARVSRDRLNQIDALLQMDARELTFPDESFDAVAAMHVISVVPEPRRVMAEIARVLRPGGRLVMTNHFSTDRGPMARIERGIAPFADLLGWHSDFPMSTVTETPGLNLIIRKRKPPMGIMTFLVFEKV
ncbi:class I SAM-dependent methyltransferase [Roseivivax isoporae]|uniref:SAM-dependent methlyltransferase n=1 Tax=Roseivivax isoporae LMG 25204 TaxID=1449351 RepID=X7FDY7_9RHOB|nr:class I SAM-dependent methyltransferase [Roseivivax isoporae]ETX30296.1 SAM-dependent methlyltransferase [Roseivivax isoporae LMG 25204]